MQYKTKQDVTLTFAFKNPDKMIISEFKSVRVTSEGSVLDKKQNPTMYREIYTIDIDGLFLWKYGDLNVDILPYKDFLKSNIRKIITNINKREDIIEITYEEKSIKKEPETTKKDFPKKTISSQELF